MALDDTATPELRTSLAAWLEQRRQHIHAVAQELGLPEMIRTPIMRVVPSGNGFSGEVTEVTTSPVADRRLAHRLANVARPLLDEEANDIGGRLRSAAGGGRDIWTAGLGAASGQTAVAQGGQFEGAEYGAAVTFRSAPGRLLLRLLEAYLAGLQSLGTADASLAQRLVDELLSFVQASTVTVVTNFPVGGIEAASDLSQSDVRLRPLEPEEIGYLLQSSSLLAGGHRMSPAWTPIPKYEFERHALEIREPAHKPAGDESLVLSPWSRKVVLAFQLHDVDLWGDMPAASWIEPRWLGLSSVVSPLTIRPSMRRATISPKERTLTEEMLGEVAALAGKLPDAAGSIYPDMRGREELALRRFALGASRTTPNDSLVDFVVALESVLLPGIREELRYRFAINGAAFLGRSYADRSSLFDEFRRCYDARSGLVHGSGSGGKLPTPQQIEDDSSLARVLASRVLREAVTGGWPTLPSLTDAVLGSTGSDIGLEER